MIAEDKITQIFCLADDSCKYFSTGCLIRKTWTIESRFIPSRLSVKVKEKLGGDKRYVGKKIFDGPAINGIQLVTKVKRNMKNSLMSVGDKIMLGKRAIVDSGKDEMKYIDQMEQARHRSFTNFITYALSVIAAYLCCPKKNSISLEFVFDLAFHYICPS